MEMHCYFVSLLGKKEIELFNVQVWAFKYGVFSSPNSPVSVHALLGLWPHQDWTCWLFQQVSPKKPGKLLHQPLCTLIPWSYTAGAAPFTFATCSGSGPLQPSFPKVGRPSEINAFHTLTRRGRRLKGKQGLAALSPGLPAASRFAGAPSPPLLSSGHCLPSCTASRRADRMSDG